MYKDQMISFVHNNEAVYFRADDVRTVRVSTRLIELSHEMLAETVIRIGLMNGEMLTLIGSDEEISELISTLGKYLDVATSEPARIPLDKDIEAVLYGSVIGSVYPSYLERAAISNKGINFRWANADNRMSIEEIKEKLDGRGKYKQ